MTFAELTGPPLWAGAVHLAMWTVGRWARTKLLGPAAQADDPAARASQAVMLGFAIFGTVAFVLGVAHVLYTPLVAALVVVPAAAGAVRVLRAWPWRVGAPSLSDVPLIACLGFMVGQLPRALVPVLAWDENVYHLLLPKLYLASHALLPLPWSLFANMPHLIDLSYVFPMSIGGIAAAKVFVWGIIAWTLVGMAPLGRAMLGPIGPGVFAVLFLSGLVVQWHLGLTYVEPVIGALVLGAVHSLWRYREEGDSAELRVAAILAGAACASKYTVWPLAAVLFAIVVIARPRGGARIGLRVALTVVGLGALVLVPWLVRNAIVTGNPVYPNAYGFFGGANWSQIQAVQHQHELGYGRGADTAFMTYLTLPFHVVASRYEPNRGTAGFSSGVMVLLLASMCFPWRRAEFRTTLRFLSIAAFVSWSLGPQHTRYLVAFIPVMVVTAGIPLVPLRRFRFALPAVTVAIALTALIQMALQPYPAAPLLDAFTVSSKELLSRNHCWALTEFLNRLVPSNGRVLRSGRTGSIFSTVPLSPTACGERRARSLGCAKWATRTRSRRGWQRKVSRMSW